MGRFSICPYVHLAIQPQAWLSCCWDWLAGPQAWLDGPEGGGGWMENKWMYKWTISPFYRTSAPIVAILSEIWGMFSAPQDPQYLTRMVLVGFKFYLILSPESKRNKLTCLCNQRVKLSCFSQITALFLCFGQAMDLEWNCPQHFFNFLKDFFLFDGHFWPFLAIFANFELTVQKLGETKSANFLIFMLHITVGKKNLDGLLFLP